MTIAHLTTIMFAIFYISEVHTNSILKKIIKKYSTINEQDTKDYATLRNALEEIRELAEKSIKISYNLEINSILYDIIHKINEVLG